MNRPRMVDTDGVLICTNDMYAAWNTTKSNIKEDDIEITETDANDAIGMLYDLGFDILLFSAYGEV